ncbi:MAG: Fic family protein [Dehalococcoidia bacterium]
MRRAAGTTQIEGASLSAAEVGKLVNRSSVGKYTEDEQANINALEAYEFIDYLSDQQDIPIDELVIRELNRQFIRGAPETLTPGVYRRGQNTVGNYTPPDQGDVPGLVRSFALWLREEDEMHPILKAGIAHLHLVAIHPFWDGNGRTARGLSTLVLQRSPFGFRKLLALESWLSDIRSLYFSALETTLGRQFSPSYDATPWLDFFLRSLLANVDNLVAELTDWHRMMQDLQRTAASEGWEPRFAEGYAFAMNTGQITRADYIEITGVSPATASRDLAELVKAGMLIPEGKTRTRVYRVSPPESKTSSPAPEEQLALLPEI